MNANGTFSKKFHRQTDFHFPVGTTPTDPQYWPKEWKEIYHKEYPRMPKIQLSRAYLDLHNLQTALESRFSTREFDVSKKITLAELNTLLYYTAGVKPRTDKNLKIRRHYPSGGARYPLEIYLYIQRVENLEQGLYHYNVRKHLLEILSTDMVEMNSLKSGLLYPWSREAAVVLFTTAVWNRNMMKYKDRGYRIILMESGHMAQNLALVATALNIGCCNSVGFDNGYINSILDIEHEDEDSLCMAVLGK